MRFASEAGADLIVVGKHGTRPPCQDRTGAVASRVLERARCPVIAVPSNGGNGDAAATTLGDREQGIRGVLVATDLSESSSAALTFGRAIGQRLCCPVHLLLVVESPWTRSPAYAPPPPVTIEALRRSAALGLEASEAHSLPGETSGVQVRRIVRIGDPATEIVACAQQLGDDLIVLGTRGHGALRRALLGSVARDVLARATCPTMTVRGRRTVRARHRYDEEHAAVVTPMAGGDAACRPLLARTVGP